MKLSRRSSLRTFDLDQCCSHFSKNHLGGFVKMQTFGPHPEGFWSNRPVVLGSRNHTLCSTHLNQTYFTRERPGAREMICRAHESGRWLELQVLESKFRAYTLQLPLTSMVARLFSTPGHPVIIYQPWDHHEKLYLQHEWFFSKQI